MKPGRPNYGKTQDEVWTRICDHGPGWAFTPSDFADLGDPRSIGMVLSRLTKHGEIRRIRRGLYEVPKQHPLLGLVGAGSEAILDAIARRDGLKLLPSGAASANNLGLSTQVPAVTSYGISGTSRVVAIRDRSMIRLQHRSPKAMTLAGKASGYVAQALRNLGQGKVGSRELQVLKNQLPPQAKKELLEDLRYVPAWMRPIFKELAQHA